MTSRSNRLIPSTASGATTNFEEGYVIERIVGPEEIPSRAIAVAVVLGLLMLGGLVYFLAILGGL